MSDLVGNPEDRFSRVAAQIVMLPEYMNLLITRSRGYKTFFMFNSAETKIYPAHKC